MLKLASWNVNSLRVRLPQVLQWLASAQPDVLGIQETKCVDEEFPVAELESAGYRAIYSGQKTYNGVAVLSKLDAEPIDIVTDIPGLDDHQRRVLGATYGALRFIDLYVPNGSEIGSDKYAYKLEWLNKLGAYLKQQLALYPNLVVVGDFNIAPDARDVHDPQLWEGQVLFSGPEREALAQLLGLGLVDTFRLFEQPEASFSQAAFRRNRGLRIDHVLASTALSSRCTSSTIDKDPRGWERPSDHAPVVAVFDV